MVSNSLNGISVPNIKFYLYPYKQGSKSAKALATALGGKVLRLINSHFHGPNSRRKVINWGSSDINNNWECLNANCGIWSNKLNSFVQWQSSQNGPRIPPFTTSPTEAAGWLSKGSRVVCRGTLTGHSGAGITIVEGNKTGDQTSLPQVPLYVKYIPKDQEYRVHVFNFQGQIEVIDVQRKVRDPSREPSNWQVRSHQNGFIFTRNDQAGNPYKTSCPPDVLEQAKRALGSSGLTFGAVDVIWSAKKEEAYVLECNCAPGLEGTTVSIYAEAIKRYYGV